MKLLGATLLTFVAVCLPLAVHAGDLILTNDGRTFSSNTASAGVMEKTTALPTDHTSSVPSVKQQGTTPPFAAPAPEPGTLLLLGTGLIATGILVRRVAA
jgi:hypothetical protein